MSVIMGEVIFLFITHDDFSVHIWWNINNKNWVQIDVYNVRFSETNINISSLPFIEPITNSNLNLTNLKLLATYWYQWHLWYRNIHYMDSNKIFGLNYFTQFDYEVGTKNVNTFRLLLLLTTLTILLVKEGQAIS